MKKCLCIILTIAMMFCLSACSNTENTTQNQSTTEDESVTIINFESTTRDDLEKLDGQTVAVYGYFMLNPIVNRTVYIAKLPYSSLTNDQSQYEETTYRELSMYADKAISVQFKSEQEYKSIPICVVGTLRKGQFRDSYYYKYDYMIVNAESREIATYQMPAELQQFYFLAEHGYTDIIYDTALQTELFLAGNGDLPTIDKYNDIISELYNISSQDVASSYLVILTDEKNMLDAYGTSNDKEAMTTAIDEVYSEFFVFLQSYAQVIPQT